MIDRETMNDMVELLDLSSMRMLALSPGSTSAARTIVEVSEDIRHVREILENAVKYRSVPITKKLKRGM